MALPPAVLSTSAKAEATAKRRVDQKANAEKADGKESFPAAKDAGKGKSLTEKNGDPLQVKLLFTCKLLFHYGFRNFEESIEQDTVIIFFPHIHFVKI